MFSTLGGSALYQLYTIKQVGGVSGEAVVIDQFPSFTGRMNT
jgi:hypothetical protein